MNLIGAVARIDSSRIILCSCTALALSFRGVRWNFNNPGGGSDTSRVWGWTRMTHVAFIFVWSADLFYDYFSSIFILFNRDSLYFMCYEILHFTLHVYIYVFNNLSIIHNKFSKIALPRYISVQFVFTSIKFLCIDCDLDRVKLHYGTKFIRLHSRKSIILACQARKQELFTLTQGFIPLSKN